MEGFFYQELVGWFLLLLMLYLTACPFRGLPFIFVEVEPSSKAHIESDPHSRWEAKLSAACFGRLFDILSLLWKRKQGNIWHLNSYFLNSIVVLPKPFRTSPQPLPGGVGRQHDAAPRRRNMKMKVCFGNRGHLTTISLVGIQQLGIYRERVKRE